MKTKIFVILLITIPLLLIAGGVYYFYKISQKPGTQNAPPEVIEQASPLQVFVSEPTISPILSFSGNHIWFATPEGRLFRQPITSSGEREGAEEYLLPELVAVSAPLEATLSSAEWVEGLQQVFWQKEGSDFIVEQNLAGHTRYKFFDADKRIFIDYPPEMQKARFLAGGQKIVYDWVTSEGKHELKVSDADGKNFVKVAPLFRSDYELEASPRTMEVVLFVSDPGKPPSRIFAVDLETGRFRDLGEEGAFEGVKYSPDGSVLLAAKFTSLPEGPPPGLVVFYLDAQTSRNLGISASIDETAWSENGAEIIIGSKEGFRRYNLALGESKETYKFDSTDDLLPRDVIWHSQKSLLLFRDERSGYLYRLDLDRSQEF